MPRVNCYRSILKQEYLCRFERNAAYSLRAFARDLNISPARLSEVMNGNQRLSRRTAEKIVTSLGLSQTEKNAFLALVDLENPWSANIRLHAKGELRKIKQDSSYKTLKEDTVNFFSSWYHAALFEIISLNGFNRSTSKMARALKIPKSVAHEGMSRLQRLGLVKFTRAGFQKVNHNLDTSDGIPSRAIKNVHSRMLDKAKGALDSQDVKARRFDNMILTIDRKHLPEAQKKLQNFVRNFNESFGNSQNPTDVYCLSVQLFNLTEGVEEAKHV